MKFRCSWDDKTTHYCVQSCEDRRRSYTEDCQREYDLALACFNDDSKWSCDGLTGCDDAISDYDYCTNVDCPLPDNPACAVCDELRDRCTWAAYERCGCRSACGNFLTLEGDCQEPLDTLAACVADATAWSCDGQLDGCEGQWQQYMNCTAGDSGWECDAMSTSVPTWANVDGLPPWTNAFAMDGQGWVYAACGEPDGTNAGVFVSKDGGLSFSPTSTHPPSGQVSSIVVQAGTLYAVFGMRVFSSDDAGVSWTQTGPDTLFGSEPAVIADPFTEGRLYGLEMEGPKRSDDGGQSWKSIREGLPSMGSMMDIRVLLPSPDTDGLLYAVPAVYAETGSGIFASDDHGDSWKPANTGMEAVAITKLVAGPGGSLWALDLFGTLYYSANAGQSWTTQSIAHPCVGAYGNDGAWELLYGQSLFAFVSTGKLLESGDGGASWTLVVKSVQDYPEIGSVLADPSGHFVLAAGREGVLRYGPVE